LRIEKISQEVLKFLGGPQTQNQKGAGKVQEQERKEGVEVNLSAQAKMVEPELPNEKKVEEIKRAIREGNYSVDAHRISEALLKEILGG
jgi:negative regulator of flagellin synthesis FlgM